jgi:hypothetical protein
MKTENSQRPDGRIVLLSIMLFAACCHTAVAQTATGTPSATANPSETVTNEGSGFEKSSCQCTCDGKLISATGLYKAGFLESINPFASAAAMAAKKCQDQCARTCGGITKCASQADSECGTCCDTFCTSSYSGGGGTSSNPGETPTDLCRISCKSTCKFKGTINGITDIIYMIAGMLGALMITIHGIRMVTSQDPHDRDSAKSSIIHVILALIIIAMAAALVNMFITMGNIDTGPSPTPTAVDCNKYATSEPVCNAAGGGGVCSWKAAGICMPCKDAAGKVIATCGQYWPDAATCNANVCGIGGGCVISGKACIAQTTP